VTWSSDVKADPTVRLLARRNWSRHVRLWTLSRHSAPHSITSLMISSWHRTSEMRLQLYDCQDPTFRPRAPRSFFNPLMGTTQHFLYCS
jgi:hypothetical protein